MSDAPQLIQQLEQFDNKHGYRMTHKQAEQQLQPVVHAIVKQGEQLLPHLHEPIKYEETWSCYFALRALKEIKNPKSIPHLIEFIKRTSDGHYWESGEKAMFALNAIGIPAVEPLIQATQEMLQNKKCDTYLIGALTEIKDKRVYSYMVSILEDYEKNHEKYDGWFAVDAWCFDFVEQGHKEALPLLKRVLAMPNLTEHERIEIRDTIDCLENPEEWQRQMDNMIAEVKRKIGRNEPCPCGSGKKYKKCCMK